MNIAPDRTLVAALWVGAGLAVATRFDTSLLVPLGGYLLAVAGVAAVELRLLLARPLPAVERDAPDVVPVGAAFEVKLRIVGEEVRERSVVVFDEMGASVDGPREPDAVRIGGDRVAELTLTRQVRSRGLHALGPLQVSWTSALRFWRRRAAVGPAVEVRAYPNLRLLAGAELVRARASGGSRSGDRKRGNDTEFAGLRDYQHDDSYRSIDWRASARRGRLVVREYQGDEEQDVVLVLDRGRSMIARVGESSLFEKALEATLSLAMVAIDGGDNVGALVYGLGPEAWLPPQRSRMALTRIVGKLGTLEAETLESDPLDTAQALKARLKRRSLVVWFSRPLDSAAAQRLVHAARLLHPQHLVLVVVFRDREVEAMLSPQTLNQADGAEQVVAASALLAEARGLVEQLTAGGALTLQVHPQQLDVDLVNRYLTLKAEHRL